MRKLGLLPNRDSTVTIVIAIVVRYLHGRFDAGNVYIAVESPSTAFLLPTPSKI
jgi:hypothetical protein